MKLLCLLAGPDTKKTKWERDVLESIYENARTSVKLTTQLEIDGIEGKNSDEGAQGSINSVRNPGPISPLSIRDQAKVELKTILNRFSFAADEKSNAPNTFIRNRKGKKLRSASFDCFFATFCDKIVSV